MSKRIRVSPDRELEAVSLFKSHFCYIGDGQGGALVGTRETLPDVTIEVDQMAPMGTMEEVA